MCMCVLGGRAGVREINTLQIASTQRLAVYHFQREKGRSRFQKHAFQEHRKQTQMVPT